MTRRWVVLALVALPFVILAVGSYFLFFRTETPPSVVPTVFEDTKDGLPTPERFAELAQTDPVAMLNACLSRYTREAKGFRATMEKQEQLKGTLHPPEVLKVSIREEPVAVSMRWVSGARPFLRMTTQGVAYEEGQNGNQMRAWQPDAISILRKEKLDPKGFFARDAARYCITDAGLLPTMLRTRDIWDERQKAGEFKFIYHGIRPVEKLGGRSCHVLERICPRREMDSFARNEATPTDAKLIERDGFDSVTIYIDAETWLQTGTELKQSAGNLVGAYYFRDMEFNPTFTADEFTLDGLKKKP